MLRILGSPKTLCDGLTRRETLIAGGLGLFGLSLPGFFRLQEAAAGLKPAARAPKAKAVILLHLYGSHSQLETVDMKPDAPPEVRGELKPIRSALPGCDVCELLPNMAKVMDRVTVVRSVTHPYPIHGVAYALTGVPEIDVQMELSPYDAKHWPFIGSVVDHLLNTSPDRKGGVGRGVPDNVALPFPFSNRRVGEVPRAGPYAAFLGSMHNPTWTEFLGESTRSVIKTLTDKTEDVKDPYLGITPQSRFQLATSTELPTDMTIDRLQGRRSLSDQFDHARRQHDADTAGKTLDRHRAMAFNLINSDKVRKALDIQSESPRLRDSYGMTLFGQSCLAARRLVEAGSRFVTVFWDEYGLAGSGWDTHWDHYPRMKDELLPGLDMGYAGLIADLDARGLLDETLVLLVSEHGRTPKLNNAKGGGRDHWSQAYSCWFAGGGVARGRVIGKTDKIAASVLERPVSPKDILATTYHLLGIDPHTLLTDRTGRPMPLVQDAHVVQEMLA